MPKMKLFCYGLFRAFKGKYDLMQIDLYILPYWDSKMIYCIKKCTNLYMVLEDKK